jgi:hypothetical protein
LKEMNPMHLYLSQRDGNHAAVCATSHALAIIAATIAYSAMKGAKTLFESRLHSVREVTLKSPHIPSVYCAHRYILYVYVQ